MEYISDIDVTKEKLFLSGYFASPSGTPCKKPACDELIKTSNAPCSVGVDSNAQYPGYTSKQELESSIRDAETSFRQKLRSFLQKKFTRSKGYIGFEEGSCARHDSNLNNVLSYLVEVVTTIYFITKNETEYEIENIRWIERLEYHLGESLKGIKNCLHTRATKMIELHFAAIKTHSDAYGKDLHPEYIPDWTPKEQGELDCLTNSVISECTQLCKPELDIMYKEELLQNTDNVVLY